MTDTVTVSRELLRQVLEAVNSYPHRHLTPSIAATRVALRAALEQPAPVQEPIGYLAFRDGKPSWDEDCVCEDAVYPVDADDDRVSVAIYTAPQPDRIAQLEAANTNLFEQGQKMHKRIQELERDCKIGAQEMVKAYEEIDNLKAQVSWQKPVAWCRLGLDGKIIAYFDGKPMIMTGHVGNQHHPTPLFTAQPRKAVKLSDSEILTALDVEYVSSAQNRELFLSDARTIEQAVWAKLGVSDD